MQIYSTRRDTDTADGASVDVAKEDLRQLSNRDPPVTTKDVSHDLCDEFIC